VCNSGMNQFLMAVVHILSKSRNWGGGGREGRQFPVLDQALYCQKCKLHNCVTKKTLSRNVFLVESVSTCTT
jgi:hypothetical protein